MMTLKKVIIGVALITVTPLATAAAIEGVYIAADLGRSTYSNYCNGAYASCKDHDFSHRTAFGYQIDWGTAAELGYYSSGQASKKSVGSAYTIDSVEWQLSGIKYFQVGPPKNHISVFGRLGITHWEIAETVSPSTHTNASGNALLVGVGGMLEFTPASAARIQYQLHRAGNNATLWQGNIGFLSAGLTYLF